jgi:hypothetical protein
LVSNVIFAPILLKEKIGPRDVLATLTIITGSSISVAFASHENTVYTIEQLFSFYTRLHFLVYSALIGTALLAMLLVLKWMERVEVQDPLKYDQIRTMHRFAYPAISGTVGAQSVLFAKCTVELLVNTLQGKGALFSYYQTFLVLAAMAFTVFLQISWLNEGLRRFSAAYTVPVFQAFWILLSVVAGLVFYDEYLGMTTTQMWMFAFGVLITVAGVSALSQRTPHERLPDEPNSGLGSAAEDLPSSENEEENDDLNLLSDEDPLLFQQKLPQTSSSTSGQGASSSQSQQNRGGKQNSGTNNANNDSYSTKKHSSRLCGSSCSDVSLSVDVDPIAPSKSDNNNNNNSRPKRQPQQSHYVSNTNPFTENYQSAAQATTSLAASHLTKASSKVAPLASVRSDGLASNVTGHTRADRMC